jgi:hypothetical protein
MKPKRLTFLLAALALLLTTLPGYAQQAQSRIQSVTFRILELPAEFQNSASFVEWVYTPTDDTLKIGNENAGVILLGKKWHNNANMWLPLGLNEQGSLNLQLNPCRDSSQSVLWEPYNDSANWVLVDASILNDTFTLSIYTDDTPAGGAGDKLVLSAEDFASASSVEMIAIPAPTESFGQVSGLTSSLPDQYNLLAEDLGGFWLGNNGLPTRGVGLNQGERFTSAQVPPCDPQGPEYANDMGDSVILLPRETACAADQITLWENDLDGQPSGASWPITLGPALCAPPTTTFNVSADIPLAPEFCGESSEITGHIAIQADTEPPAGDYGFTLQNTTYPMQFSNEFAAGAPVTVTVTTGPNAVPWSLHRDQTQLVSGTLEINGTSTGPCRPRDDDDNSTTVYLSLIAFGQPDRAGDEASCADGQLVITNEFGRYLRPLDSQAQLTMPNLPYTSATTIAIEGAEAGRFVQYSPTYFAATGLTYAFPGGHPGAEWRVEIFSEVGGQQCHASLRANIDP